MTLKELNVGQTASVVSLGGTGALRQHFLDMGVFPGAEITLVKFAPMGDPMQLRIHGYELTLRLADAKRIEVKPFETSAKKSSGEIESDTDSLPVLEHPGFGEMGRSHSKLNEHPLPKGQKLTFALVGNQNAGKTTLFNQLTGMNQH